MNDSTLPEKPTPAFEVVFEGAKVVPEKIPLGVLARTLAAIQSLASGDEIPDEEDEEQETLRLLGMRRGSAIFEIYAPSPLQAMVHLRDTGQVIDRSRAIDDFHHILSPVERLSGTARKMDCSIVVKEPGDGGAVLARVGGATYHDLSRSLFIRGETSLMANVQRVGGVKDLRCGLRVAKGDRLLVCRVSRREVARTMGHHLYENVIVHGEATWLKDSWRLVTFTVERVSLLKDEKFSKAIEALREAGGSDWDLIEDPQAFLDEMRGES